MFGYRFLNIIATIWTIIFISIYAWADKPFMLPRQGIQNETVITKDIIADCAIIYPANEPKYLALIAKINNVVRDRLGLDIPVYPDTDIQASKFVVADKFRNKNLILLGNINNNAAMVKLAASFLVYVSEAWPGENGYELRTVVNPYGTKANCLILGGSDIGGVTLAVNEFLRLLPEPKSSETLIIPPLLTMRVRGIDQATLGPIDAGPSSKGIQELYRFASICNSYNISGSNARLKDVKYLLSSYLANGQVPADEDYGTEAAIRALDQIDTLALTPEENQEMDNRILQWVLRLLEEKPYWNPLGRQWSFGGHQAAGALSFYTAVNYLLRNGNPNEAARSILIQKLTESRQYLSYLSSSFKDPERDMGWETWTPLTIIPRYALAEEDMTFFDSGTARDVVKRYFYADRGFGPAALVSFATGDGELKSLTNEGAVLSGWAFPIEGARWNPAQSLAAKPPSFLTGTKVMRSSHTDWEHAYQNSNNTESNWHTDLPWKDTFHVIGFTDGVDKENQFMVLGGWDSNATPGDANSIRFFRESGHYFLSNTIGDDQRKPRPGRFYQNSVVVDCGDYSAAPPCGSKLLGHYDSTKVGMSLSRLSNYHGMDWDRAIFWKRSKFFVVLDACTALKNGNYTVVDQWWTNDPPVLAGNRWTTYTDKGTFRLIMDDPGMINSRQWWDGGPYQLQQTKLINAREHEMVSFYNAFYLNKPDSPQDYQIRRIDSQSMIIRGRDGDIALMGYREGGKPFEKSSLHIQANLFFVSSDIVALSDSGKLKINGRVIHISEKDTPTPSDSKHLKSALESLWRSLVIKEPVRQKDMSAGNRSYIRTINSRTKIAKTDLKAISGVSFKKKPDGTILWDLGHQEKIARIDGIRVNNEHPVVAYSSDGFHKDMRTVEVSASTNSKWVSYQYGYAAKLGQGILGPIDQKARYFQIGKPEDKLSYGLWIAASWHNQDWNIIDHNPELFNRPFWQDVVFRSNEPQVEFTKTMAADLDNDGYDEALATTSCNQLLVLDSNGKVLWNHGFDGPVKDMVCSDLDNDGHLEIIAACYDNFIYCFGIDGQLRYKVGLLSEPTPSVANSICAYDNGNGRKGFMAGTYHFAIMYDSEGKRLNSTEASGFYIDTAMPYALDFTGDGISDFIIRENVWGLVALIDGKDFKTLASFNTGYRGKGLAIVPWIPGKGDKIDSVIVIAQEGITRLRIGGGKAGTSAGGSASVVSGGDITPIFSLPIAPITSWDIADLDSDGQNEILLGTLYGSVVVVAEDGRVLSTVQTGTNVYDISVIMSESCMCRILIATEDGISIYDSDMKLLARQAVFGEPCIKLQRMKSQEKDRALCFFSDGTGKIIAYK